MVSRFAPLWWGDRAQGNADSIQVFSNNQLGKLISGVSFVHPSSLAGSSSIPFTQHDPPILKCLFRNLAFGRVGEYFQAICTLAPFFLTPASSNTTLVFTALHLKLDGYFPFFSKIMSQTKTLNFFLIPSS
jgi:hypothetical protein